jgi:hypothetical protein
MLFLRAIFRTHFKCLYNFTLFRISTSTCSGDGCRLYLILSLAVGAE